MMLSAKSSEYIVKFWDQS